MDGVPQPRMREASSHCAHGYRQHWDGGCQRGCELRARDVIPVRKGLSRACNSVSSSKDKASAGRRRCIKRQHKKIIWKHSFLHPAAEFVPRKTLPLSFSETQARRRGTGTGSPRLLIGW